MGERWRDLGLALLAVVTVVLAALALRPPEPPSTAAGDLLQATTEAQPVLATGGRPKPKVVVFGDSYAAGVGATSPKQTGYVAELSKALQWDISVVPALGGGYIAGGYDGPMINLIGRINLKATDPDLVILQAGHNDIMVFPAQLESRVTEVIEAVRVQAPRAQIVVVGMLWPGKPPAEAEAADAAMSRAAAKAGALFTYTFDLRFPAAGGIRPTDEGYRDIAVRLRSSFTDLGLAPR